MAIGLILYTIGMFCFAVYLCFWVVRRWNVLLLEDPAIKIIVISVIVSLLWPITTIIILARRLFI